MGGTTIPLIPGLGADPAAASVVSTGEVRHLAMSRADPGEGAVEPSYRYVKRYMLGGEEVVVDTVATAWKPPGDPEGFAPLLRAGVLPDGGVAFTDSSAYAIKITAPGGALSRILTRPFGAVPVTDGVKAAYVERELEDLQRSAERGNAGTKAMADFRRAQLESMEFHHEIPVVRGLRTSREGTIWVRRRGHEPGSNGPIDPDCRGRPLSGKFRPRRYRPAVPRSVRTASSPSCRETIWMYRRGCDWGAVASTISVDKTVLPHFRWATGHASRPSA